MMVLFPRLRLPLAALLLAAVIAAAFVFVPPGNANAQGDGPAFVDVELILEVPDQTSATVRHVIDIIVVNNGTITAYDVVVVVDVEYPTTNSRFNIVPAVPVGSASLETKPGATADARLRWTIPALGGLQREEVTASVRHKKVSAPIFDNSQSSHEISGTVTTSSHESAPHQENNNARVWSSRYSISTEDYRQAGGNYTLDVSVDNFSPAPGDNVNFTITTDRTNPYPAGIGGGQGETPRPIDLKVAIGLTGGLTAGTATFASISPSGVAVAAPSSVSYSNGVFNVGTLKRTDEAATAMTLPVTVPTTNPTGAEQCLTATLTGNPPPGTGPLDDDISDNVAKLCLGQAEPLESDEQIDAFTIYPCVDSTDPPCDSTDDVRIRAVYKSAGFRRILSPGAALVHVPDRPNREFDNHANSVNAGTKVSWQVDVTWNGEKLDAVNTQWSKLTDGFTASGTDGGSPPGAVNIRAFPGESYEIPYEMNSGTTPPWTGIDTVGYNPAASNGPHAYQAEFEKLGTYKIAFTANLTRATLDGDEDCDTNNDNTNDAFCATETVTFHIGPMADLAVEDGGKSALVAADEHALTIVAVNNGPSNAGSVKATGLPTGATVIDVSQGTYDGSAGEWDIGELKTTDRYRSGGEPNPTLVLGASAGDTANVTIASPENYEVCVGPKSNPVDLAHTTQTACEAVTNASWNSTPVYDYNGDNDTATITAQAGAAGVADPDDDVPEVANAAGNGASVTVTWQEVETVNGLAVSHYVVERSASPWTEIASNVVGTSYVDTDVTPGETYQYRVRAVNGAGVAGPPSAPMSGTAGPGAGGGGGGGGTRVVYRDRDRAGDDDDGDYTHYATLETTRAVAENSPAGATVGSPVAADTNRGNRVTYSLEGQHAHLFDVEPDTGQILVGEGAALDYESGTRAYTVVVVADPARGSNARATVTITVTDVAETGTLALSPATAPAVGQPLTATLAHPAGKVASASWQWQRSPDGVAWETTDSNMDGQDGQDGVVPSPLTGVADPPRREGQDGGETNTYTPTEADAGHRLRVIVVYREPGAADGLALAGLVTAALPGEAVGAGAKVDSDSAGVTESRTPVAFGVALLSAGDVSSGDPLVAYLVGDGEAPVWSSWQWQRSLDGAAWADITGADNHTYYPTDADAGHLLRVIYTWVPAGSLDPSLVGAVTARLPGDSNMDGQDGQDAGAAIAPVEPTAGPTPVAAAPPAMPTAAPQPTPMPTAAPTAVPQPTEAAMAEVVMAEAATPVGTLLTAASVGARGLGNTAPAAAPSLPEGGGTVASSETAASAADGRVEPAASPPTQNGQLVRGQDRSNVLVWVVMAVFAALVVAGGLGYYGLRMRRR